MFRSESQRRRFEHARQMLAASTDTTSRSAGVVATGLPALDAVLPGEGLPGGAITELIGPSAGGGRMTLAMRFAARATGTGRHLVLVDRRREFYPPAVARSGLDLSRLLVVRPASWVDALWAFEESLRCPAVGAVIGPLSRFSGRASRRLQLAAERGGTLGLLVCDAEAGPHPSFAAVQLEVEPVGIEARRPQFRVTVRKARFGWAAIRQRPLSVENQSILVTLTHETGDVSVSAVSSDRTHEPEEHRTSA